ncbi:MAG TPA: tetratricopeptide repeat protein [Bryobacteraceae bacterium]|nr:tetratricopeptide repeat protein [Bryobacteraceae bacterium]
MWRSVLISLAIMMALSAGWLFSDDMERPDLANVIRNIEQSLHQLQGDIKDLRGSVKQLSRTAKEDRPPQAVQVSAGTAASATTAPVASALQRAQDAYEHGKALEEQKLYGQAIESFTKAIELDAKNDSAYLRRGVCRYQLGNYADSVSDLTQSLALQPNNSQAYGMRASALAEMGQASAAMADANEAIRRNGTNPENYTLRASLHQRSGEIQMALEDYGQAITVAPQFEKAYLGRAALLRTQGQLAASLKDCYQAIELRPSDPAAYLCRAEFYLASGAAQPAIADINRALLDGQNPVQAAPMLTAAKQMLEGKEGAAQQAQAPAPPAPAPAGISGTATTAAVARLTTPPAGMPSPQTLAQVPVQNQVTKPVVVTGSAAPPVLSAAVVHTSGPAVANQPPVQAARLAQPPASASRGAVSKAQDANALYREGRLYADQQRFADALPFFDQAIQVNPNLTVAYNARCYAYLRLKDYDRAIADCTQAIQRDPSYANAYRNRAVARHFKGDQAGANEDYQHVSALEAVAQVQTGKP